MAMMQYSSEERWLQETSTMDEEDNEKSSTAVFAAVMSSILLFLLIFGLSATVDMKNLKKQIRNKFALGTGIAMQFIIMPLLGFCSVVLLKSHGLTHAMGLTLLVVTSSPGGSYSNWWCSTFNADLALSVAMTAISTILSVGLLPANLLLYTHLAFKGDDDMDDVIQAVDFGALFISLGIVIAAILSGLFCSWKFDNPVFHKWANRGGSISGIALIIFSAVIGSGAGNSDSSFWSHHWTFYVGVAFPCLTGLAIANAIARCCRLEKPEVVAIAVECCYQNVGIATSVAITMFDDPTERAEAVSVPLFYGLVEAVVLGIYCVVSWKLGWTKAPKDEKICVVVTKTYEIVDHQEEESENFDEEELQDLAPSTRGWWKRLSFRNTKEQDDDTSKEEKERPDRNRIVSEDYTASTSETAGTMQTSSGDVENSLESIQEIPSFVRECSLSDEEQLDVTYEGEEKDASILDIEYEEEGEETILDDALLEEEEILHESHTSDENQI